MLAKLDLRNHTNRLGASVADIKERFTKAHPGSGFGFPSDFDYARYSVVFDLIQRPGGTILDVGVGSGQLINALALSQRFQRVCGIDLRQHSKFTRFSDGFDLRFMDVAAMEFGDGEFDVVVCMEVLEHLTRPHFTKALAELRRVCNSRLLVSVPYAEPEPLPRHHKMRFRDEDLREHFPTAQFMLLEKPGLSWVLIDEARA